VNLKKSEILGPALERKNIIAGIQILDTVKFLGVKISKEKIIRSRMHESPSTGTWLKSKAG